MRSVSSTGWQLLEHTNNKGAFFNRNALDESHMIMEYFSEVYGPVRIVAFNTDGGGWSVTSAVSIARKFTMRRGCIKLIADVYNNIAARLMATLSAMTAPLRESHWVRIRMAKIAQVQMHRRECSCPLPRYRWPALAKPLSRSPPSAFRQSTALASILA
jgi:hypothetical protein